MHQKQVSNAASRSNSCRYGFECPRENCYFDHPSGWDPAKNKKLIGFFEGNHKSIDWTGFREKVLAHLNGSLATLRRFCVEQFCSQFSVFHFREVHASACGNPYFETLLQETYLKMYSTEFPFEVCVVSPDGFLLRQGSIIRWDPNTRCFLVYLPTCGEVYPFQYNVLLAPRDIQRHPNFQCDDPSWFLNVPSFFDKCDLNVSISRTEVEMRMHISCDFWKDWTCCQDRDEGISNIPIINAAGTCRTAISESFGYPVKTERWPRQQVGKKDSHDFVPSLSDGGDRRKQKKAGSKMAAEAVLKEGSSKEKNESNRKQEKHECSYASGPGDTHPDDSTQPYHDGEEQVLYAPAACQPTRKKVHQKSKSEGRNFRKTDSGSCKTRQLGQSPRTETNREIDEVGYPRVTKGTAETNLSECEVPDIVAPAVPSSEIDSEQDRAEDFAHPCNGDQDRDGQLGNEVKQPRNKSRRKQGSKKKTTQPTASENVVITMKNEESVGVSQDQMSAPEGFSDLRVERGRAEKPANLANSPSNSFKISNAPKPTKKSCISKLNSDNKKPMRIKKKETSVVEEPLKIVKGEDIDGFDDHNSREDNAEKPRDASSISTHHAAVTANTPRGMSITQHRDASLGETDWIVLNDEESSDHDEIPHARNSRKKQERQRRFQNNNEKRRGNFGHKGRDGYHRPRDESQKSKQKKGQQRPFQETPDKPSHPGGCKCPQCQADHNTVVQVEIEAARLKDYREILGVHESSTSAEIRQAYRRLAKLYHPDKFKPRDGIDEQEAALRFQSIKDACTALTGEGN